jgi:hypothetical protein
MALLLGGAALAAPPEGADPNSPMSEWYRSLTVPGSGAMCCSVADCRPVEARLDGDHWAVKMGDDWWPVPPAVILKRENLDGRPVACIYLGAIRCFIPPVGT